VVAFNAVIAPAATPPAVLEKLSADIRAVVTSPAFAERTRALGINAWGATPQELDAWFAQETGKWAEIAKAANLKAE
jgi:tripartite-type tricarboxylate transporter receptor subunit TctC